MGYKAAAWLGLGEAVASLAGGVVSAWLFLGQSDQPNRTPQERLATARAARTLTSLRQLAAGAILAP